MATENTEKKTSDRELLKTIEGVLDNCLSIFDEIDSTSDVKKAQVGIDDKMDVSAGMSVKPKALATPGIGDASTAGIVAKEEEKKDKKDDEDSDDKLKETYKSLVAKMESRGLMAKIEKSAAEAPTIKKSEAAAEQAVEDLRKSIDDRFENMAKTIQHVAETVKKIASFPKERKGVTGLTPLKKSEAPTPLKKNEVVGKLLELKKNRDPRVDSVFITRVEQGRLMKGDDDKLRALGIIE